MSAHDLFFPIQDNGWCPGLNGITRRDWLAGLVLQGIMATMADTKDLKIDVIVSDCYELSDALIAEGRRGQK